MAIHMIDITIFIIMNIDAFTIDNTEERWEGGGGRRGHRCKYAKHTWKLTKYYDKLHTNYNNNNKSELV